ncbi:hypothetical protein BpHYR1_028896 [Brachionus plicatilis]|uniref:Uncharacterized protein n=1 Tax=Brachionus plicatilis TaxID=10195 RepID=A0A3M7RZ83_BRAPC|nr:hypothetical protein BpHYR1_028896 [Brachionus plicatilis]
MKFCMALQSTLDNSDNSRDLFSVLINLFFISNRKMNTKKKMIKNPLIFMRPSKRFKYPN